MDEQHNKGLAVVTGASSGIGFELAKQFAENGFDLLVAAEDGGIVEAAQIFRRHTPQVDYIQVDLAEEGGVEKLYEKIQTLGQPVEAVAINAGVGVGGASFDKTDLQEEIKLIKLNVISSVALTKYILQDMLSAGHGRILFTSSIASLAPGPYESVYAASKAFLESFAQAVREEVKDKGVTITTLLPGATETNFFRRAGMEDTKVGQQQKDDPADVAKTGFEALMAGEGSVVAGSFKNKLFAAVSKMIPDSTNAKMHEDMSKPNSPSDR